MSKLYSIFNFLNHFKYIIVIVVGIICVGFVGNSSFLNLAQLDIKISDLKADIAREEQKDADAKRQLEELKNNPKAIEDVAREQYLMKRENEDIYVLNSEIAKKKEKNEKAQ